MKADGGGSGWVAVVEIANPELLARVRDTVLAAGSQGQ